MPNSKAPHEVALRVFQSIHGQELIKAEQRTRERVKTELARRGIAEQFVNLYPRGDEETDRVRDLVTYFKRMEAEL